MKKIKNVALYLILFAGILFTACDENSNLAEPEKQNETIVSNSEVAQIVATELSKSANSGSTFLVMNDLLQIAQSPEEVQDDDLTGLIKNDSTIIYEGDTYKTTVTYEVKYKVNNMVVDDYSILADTALVSYTIVSEYDNIQFRGRRESYSDEFVVSNIKMPTTKFTVNMKSIFRTEIQYKVEPKIILYLNGTTYFEDIIVDVYNSEIDSGIGGMEFVISTGESESDPITVEIEFTGGDKAIITVNGEQYRVNVALGLLLT